MTAPEPPAAGYVFTLGETMVLFTPRAGSPMELATGASVGIGGAESNVAIGLARLGVDVVWAGRVGDDSLGHRVLRELRAEAVRTAAVIDPAAPTAVMVKERRTALSTSVHYYRTGSAGGRLCPQDVPADLVTGAAWVHVTGITPALSPSAAATVEHVLDAARGAGVPVSFDVNHRSRLWRGAREAGEAEAATTYRQLASRADLVFAGLDEAALLAPGAEQLQELATGIQALGPAEVVLKLGAEGAFAVEGEQQLKVPAVAVPVVDTVGAGDAFVAGYLAERLRGAPLPVRLATATRAGAFACMASGDWEGLPTRADLDALDRADPVDR